MDAIVDNALRPETAPERTPVPPFDLVIFGAGGDLALRKLFPALAQRNREGVLPGESRILAIVRKEEDVEGLPKQIAKRLDEEGIPKDQVEPFLRRLTMVMLDAVKPETYGALKQALGESDRVRSFYLSTPPDLFIPICENLARADILTPTSRVILEKPLGRDLASARAINDAVARILPESRTYRIDHYLGKETVQNLLVLRFANTLFERSWSSRDIDHVQITVAETVGLEQRAGYYDKSGHMRDMVQNHLMQLLTLFAIEPPNMLEAGAVREEKIKVLKALRPIVGPDVQRYTVRGQYGAGQIDGQRVRGYSEELGHGSNTETFVAIRCEVDNWRWAGVPIYLRTGKRMAQRYSEIAVTFKPVPHSIFGGGSCDRLDANRLFIRLQPNDGVQLQLMMKVPGSGRLKIVPRQLDLRYSTAFDERTPDAYERLLTDVIRGDQTLFMHRDEVEQAWSWVDPIIAGWQDYYPHPHRYAAGSWGPSQAIGLIERDGRSWADPDSGLMAGPLAWHRFATLADASEALAEAVAVRLKDLLAGQGRALLAVPGGTTPAGFLAALGRHDLPWEQVTLLPTDERFVAADDAASNERMIRAQFAPLAEARAAFLSFHEHGSDIEAAAALLCAKLAELPEIDLLVSGMGADGHIASLFPGAEAAFNAVPDSGIVVARPPGLPPRLSLSPARLLGAGWASLLVSGAAKEAVLKAAPEREQRPLPVDLLLGGARGLDVYWAKE